MKLKALIFAVVTAVCFIWIDSPAGAQAPTTPVLTPYANFMSWVGYQWRDKAAKPDPDDRVDMDMDLIPQLNFGVQGKSGNVNINIGAALSPLERADAHKNSVYLAYVEYNKDGFGALIGKATTPYSCINFNNLGPGSGSTGIGWDIFAGYDVFEGMPYQLKFSYKGAFLMAIRNYGTDSQGPPPVDPHGSEDQVKVLIPKLAAGYTYGGFMTPLWANVSFLYQTFEITDKTGSLSSIEGKNINTWALSGFVQANMSGFEIITHLHYSVNGGTMGQAGQPGYEITTSNEVKDSKQIGGHIGFAYRIGDLKPAVGIAYKRASNDTYLKTDEDMQYFVSLNIYVQPNFILTPTFQIQDNMKDRNGDKAGKYTNLGVFVQLMI